MIFDVVLIRPRSCWAGAKKGAGADRRGLRNQGPAFGSAQSPDRSAVQSSTQAKGTVAKDANARRPKYPMTREGTQGGILFSTFFLPKCEKRFAQMAKTGQSHGGACAYKSQPKKQF